MSIELEYALEHKNDPAVLCCRMEPGEISHHNLEDPAIFPDLVDTGLLKLDGCLTIGQQRPAGTPRDQAELPAELLPPRGLRRSWERPLPSDPSPRLAALRREHSHFDKSLNFF